MELGVAWFIPHTHPKKEMYHVIIASQCSHTLSKGKTNQSDTQLAGGTGTPLPGWSAGLPPLWASPRLTIGGEGRLGKHLRGPHRRKGSSPRPGTPVADLR